MAHDPSTDRLLAGRYRLGSVLGSGGQGTVYLAEDLGRGGEQVALKLMEEVVGGFGCQEPAARDLRWFRHSNWAAVLDTGVAGENAWFQTMRYVPGRGLDTLEGPQDPDLVWQFLEDGARVLRAFHHRGLIHYDVKPGNFLLEETNAGPRFVLTDGGLTHRGPLQGVARGTPKYMAPETTEDRTHDHRADLYALGLVAFRLATGVDAYEGSAGEILQRRRRETARRATTVRPDLPKGLDDVIAELLSRNPDGRPKNGGALIRRIAERGARPVEDWLPEEAFAAADGGGLVGREELLERFGRSCAVLRQLLPGPGRRRARAVARLQDPALLVCGPSGAGATRLVREMAQVARETEVPVLLLAGRDGPPDHHHPLRHLRAGLAALGGDGQEGRGKRRKRTQRTREERAHSDQRTIEQFVQDVYAAAHRVPFLLVVEDAQELPELAREALHVLSRDLLSRHEHTQGADPAPVMLVADLGVADPKPFLIPDSKTPERPIARLDPLGEEPILALAKERFPGFVVSEDDLMSLVRACDGQPGALVALLAEGIHRNDLRPEGDDWVWRLDDLEAYAVQRRLPPILEDALRRADDDQRQVIECLALLDRPLPAEAMVALWLARTAQPLPPTPLIAVRREGERREYALATHALRSAILDGLPPEARDARARELLGVLADQPGTRFAPDRANLYLLLERPQEALASLAQVAEDLSHEERRAIQRHLRKAVTQDVSLLATAQARHRVTALLEHGPDAIEVARQIAAVALPDGSEVGAVLRLAQVLEDDRTPDAALDLLEAHKDSPKAALPDRILLQTRRAHLYLNRNRWQDGRVAMREARALMRQLGAKRDDHPRVVAQYLTRVARLLFLRGRFEAALGVLRRARQVARKTRDLALLVQVYNNLGIALVRTGSNDQALRSFERAIRIRKALGDVRGTVGLTINVVRLRLLQGAIYKATVECMDCANRAQRYGLQDAHPRSLIELSNCYDRLHRPALALNTLHRAWRTVRWHNRLGDASLIAWSAAPMAAALGRLDLCDEFLRGTAGLARLRATEFARGAHWLSSALVALHTGRRERFQLAYTRAIRHQEALRRVAGDILWQLAPLARESDRSQVAAPSGQHGRESLSGSARSLYRMGVWLRRAQRHTARVPRVPRLVGTGDERNSAIPAGLHGRLIAELILAAVTPETATPGKPALHQVVSYARLTGLGLLHARALALQSCQGKSKNRASHARSFSRAISLLDEVRPGPHASLALLPGEVVAAADNLGRRDRTPRPAVPDLRELHALAHRLLLEHGGVAEPDQRLASALRRVLEASAQMRGGGSLEDLLRLITRHTIDITGAQRACAVLLDADARLEIQVSTCASNVESEVGIEDLSNTVIQRVIRRRAPLLLHDVFEDSQLMEDSASVPELGLRTILCVPILRGDTLFGVMYADSTSAIAKFDRVDLEVLSLFAEQAAASIETSRLVEDVQSSFAELKSLQDRLVRGERLRVMGELSSGVAHEFNNLLTAILARIQMMGLNYLPPDSRKDLELVERAALDAAEVVRRLQAFSRQQRQAHFSTLDLGQVCNDAVDLLKPLWRDRRRGGRGTINVQVRVEPELHVRGDATELREVVTNILKNAIDSVGEGGRITITAGRRRGRAHVRIQDNGCGIPRDRLTRIFDPFFTTKGERGTGLGLSLTQQIIDRHGGKIEATSDVDRGTTLHFHLPVTEAAKDVPEKPAPLPTSPNTLRVVVVDDDDAVLQPLCTYLEKSGFEVISASDGAEGLQMAAEREPDVVLTDIGMPVMDGIELCRRLHASRPHLPIVLMSGWASDVDPGSAREAGAKALLAKPFQMRQVTELLTSVARQRTK